MHDSTQDNSLIRNYSQNKLFDKKIWTVIDVSRATGFSIGTIYNKTSKDEIPHRKRGSRLFFFPDEILNWLDEGD